LGRDEWVRVQGKYCFARVVQTGDRAVRAPAWRLRAPTPALERTAAAWFLLGGDGPNAMRESFTPTVVPCGHLRGGYAPPHPRERGPAAGPSRLPAARTLRLGGFRAGAPKTRPGGPASNSSGHNSRPEPTPPLTGTSEENARGFPRSPPQRCCSLNIGDTWEPWFLR